MEERTKSVAHSFMRNAGSHVCTVHEGSHVCTLHDGSHVCTLHEGYDVCILRETLRNRFYSLREGARRQVAHDIPKTSKTSQTVANVLKLQSGLDNWVETKH